MALVVGEQAPNVALCDQDGVEWSLSAHRGSPVVLYFYPKADTPGCTNQACDVRDHWVEFTELGAEVVGISPDEVAAQARFAGAYDLPHRLLADPDRVAIGAYGAWGSKSMYGKSYEGVLRCSYVVGPEGDIAAVFEKIQPKQQSAKALAAVRQLAGPS